MSLEDAIQYALSENGKVEAQALKADARNPLV